MSKSNFSTIQDMVIRVAEALGQERLRSMAFVGGLTTGFLITDEYARESVRATDDVDLIIGTLGYVQHAEFEEELRRLGFSDRQDNHVICRKWLGELQVDFMPTDDTLGFTNRWYQDALSTAQPFELKPGLTIRLLTPPHFIATKLEAYKGRGNGDILGSRDLEDVMTLIDGRSTLFQEISKCNGAMQGFISEEFRELLKNDYFEYLVQTTANGQQERIDYLYEIIDKIAGLNQ